MGAQPSTEVPRFALPPNHRVAFILDKAGLSPPQSLPTLSEPPPYDFGSSLPGSLDDARFLLVQQRINEPGYKQPHEQLRNIFRTKKSKEAKCNPDNWVFTKHEVAKAFDSLLSTTPLPAPGVAQALLANGFITSLDELWCHFHDPKLEKKMEAGSKKSRSSILPESKSSMALDTRSSITIQSTSSVLPEISWLDEACRQKNLEYIRLMCQTGLGQESLNRAFKIALSRHSMGVMELLLSFGAIASTCQTAIRERVKLNDLGLVSLLLSAPAAMSVEAWRYCIEAEIDSLQAQWKQSPLLLLCVVHRPDVICGELLEKALKFQNFQATAILLAYGPLFGQDFLELSQVACESASRVQDDELRYKFFKVFADSGFVEDCPVLREELMKDVKSHQLPLVKLLVNAGVCLDAEPNNAFRWAVSRMDLDMLELFRQGKFSSSVSLALKYVPDSTSEPDMLRFMEVFGPMGLDQQSLNLNLVRAVRRQQIELVQAFCSYGASVEFEQASAIQAALQKADLRTLYILLRKPCSPEILSKTIPTAMVLQPRPIRLEAMKALLKKGVLSQELGPPLQRLVVYEDGDIDSELLQLLLKHQAPVDGIGNSNNPVLVATMKGNFSVLKMLCDAGPRNETVSKCIIAAFGVRGTSGYDVSLKMINLLLKKGASGLPINRILLAAAREDYQLPATRDYLLQIVHALVERGADANFENGASFIAALKTSNFSLLQILCASCPPTSATMDEVLFTAIDPQYYDLQALDLLLASAPSDATTLNTLSSSEMFKDNPNRSSIIPCFLRHGLDVNLENGILLSSAIQEKNMLLLHIILMSDPSIPSLTTAFQTAVDVQPISLQLEIMRLLLDKADSAEIGQSEVLLQQINSALSGDSMGLQLILRHKAEATSSTLTKACLAIERSEISWDEKQSMFRSILSASDKVSAADKSKLLAEFVTRSPEHTQLPQLLVERGVEATFGTLEVALKTSSQNLFFLLVNNIRGAEIATKLFKHAQKITMDSERRYWIYQYLLDKNIPSNDISEALLNSLKADDLGDLSLPKLFLVHGASPGYQNGEAFSIALRASSLAAINLLIDYLSDDMATVAFDVVRKTPRLKSHIRVRVFRSLLKWNIDKSSLHDALVVVLEDHKPDISFVKLLLEKGVDPNKSKGKCFSLTSKATTLPEFRLLSKYAKRQVVLKALMNKFQEEAHVIEWFNICLEEQTSFKKIDHDELLFQCMRKFPKGTALLTMLLDNGVPPSAKINHRVCAGWELESCTALVWALLPKPKGGFLSWHNVGLALGPKIENSVILKLLAHGRNDALPAYLTPQSKISAAFLCLLDKSRTPVLEALLKLDRERILDYVIPRSSFGSLALPSTVREKESSLLDVPDELPLREASLFMGNFDAFRLITHDRPPTDGTLHLAALMALPLFVKQLSKLHDPNEKSEEFDNMIPLALVCVAKPQPWCVIANAESDFKSRQKETIQLLGPQTDVKWRKRGMTVLHFAMENGIHTTKAMIKALDIRHDRERDKNYVYIDKEGVKYTPQEWVTKVLDAEEKEKKALIKCLDEAWKTRFVPGAWD